MKIGMRVANLVPGIVLGSPLHPLMSSRYLILNFTGRTSGRRYATPVAYARTSEGVVISTDSPWWRNLDSEPRVRLQLRGRAVTATAQVVREQQEAVAALALLVRDVPGYWRPAGITRANGVVGEQALVDAVQGGRRVLALRVDA